MLRDSKKIPYGHAMKYLNNDKGFTLVEIISVILVMGIIAAVVVPSFDTSPIDATMAGNTVQADIQYTQELAMTRDQDVSITFILNSTTYDVPADPNGVFPLETRELPRGGSVTSATTTITFNSFGEKVGATENVVIQTGSETKTITVEQFTGRVTVS